MLPPKNVIRLLFADVSTSTGAAQRVSAPIWRSSLAQNKGITYYGSMNITLSLDDELVKRVRKIAVDHDTTLTGLVRDYLTKLASEDSASGSRRREREALQRSSPQTSGDFSHRSQPLLPII